MIISFGSSLTMDFTLRSTLWMTFESLEIVLLTKKPILDALI